MGTIGLKAFAVYATAVLMMGCALRPRLPKLSFGAGTKLYAVTASKAAFFHYGPLQGNGPDMQLPRDTLMTLIRPSFGYCKVHLTSGEEGYVAAEDIKPAPPALVAAVTGPPPAAAVAHVGRGQQFDLNSTDPRLDVPPEDLPMSNPEPTPLPGTSPY